MNNSESIEPNEWNVYSSELTDTPARYSKLPKVRTNEQGYPEPVNLTRASLARASEDATAKLAFDSH